MTFLPDLSPCTYIGRVPEGVLAIGWLDGSEPFPQGEASPEFFKKLQLLCSVPFSGAGCWMGSHECNVCQFTAEATASREVYVPHEARLYVAPVMILHYVNAHRYLPPEVFIAAVMGCPPIDSMAYKRAFLASGGRELLRSRRFGNQMEL